MVLQTFDLAVVQLTLQIAPGKLSVKMSAGPVTQIFIDDFLLIVRTFKIKGRAHTEVRVARLSQGIPR